MLGKTASNISFIRFMHHKNCYVEIDVKSVNKFIHHHHHNVNILPRLIEGIDGCFPTALGKQSTNIKEKVDIISRSEIVEA